MRFVDLTDGQLLERFVRDHEGAAFAALVHRHGAMVLGVCRRVLRQPQDAEDAFQATFLILVQKAGSLEQPELLANWLYGVAYRTAQQARVRAARRSHHEKEAAAMTATQSEPNTAWPELREILDRELFQLPEKYRAPLVLCYLEGKTNEEAARLLGWPIGSMSARLARGRELLRDRLSGRQHAGAALPPGVLDERPEPEHVPPFLADATVQAALALLGARSLAGGGVAAGVRDLAETTLRLLNGHSRLSRGLLTLGAALLLGAAVYAAANVWPLVTNAPPAPSPSANPAPSGGCHPTP
jgi:RNA polymerase sigma factor (sigma-70 family)